MKFSLDRLRLRETPAYVIAEVGVNHNGNVDLAVKHIEAAVHSGADAVKFQTFTAKSLVTRGTPKVRYQERTTIAEESHFEMIRRLELPRDAYPRLLRCCEDLGVDFLSTPYDLDSVFFLETLGVGLYKVASADLVDLPLLQALAQTGKPSILACGMASLGEIERALCVFPEQGRFRAALLHCVSNYPCSDGSLHLRVIPLLGNTFDIVVGFSDHSIGCVACIASIALGARIVEKHFTLDKSLPGPDHPASSTPEEFRELVCAIRRTETALGMAVKRCQDEETQMRSVSRKSIVAVRDLLPGTRVAREDFVMKRPGTGLGAEFLERLVGRVVRHHIGKDAMVELSDVE